MKLHYDFAEEEDLHQLKKIRPERDLFLVLVLLVVLVVESFGMLSLFEGNAGLTAILHVLSFVILLGVAVLKKLRERDDRFAWVAMLALPVLGPLAPLGVLFSLFWHYISKEKSLSFRQWRDSIFPPEFKTLAQVVYERIAFGREQAGEDYNVTYLMDILKMGGTEKKREAIYKILRHYEAGLAPLLRLALEDSNNMIRVQAATAITKLKNTYFLQSVKLERLRKTWPDKNGFVLELARHYDNYAFTGLLDASQERESRLMAMKYYYLYLDSEPEDGQHVPEVRQLLARLLFRMNNVEDACKHFERIRESGHATPEVNLWYGECLYRLGRYTVLRQLAEETITTPAITDDLKYTSNIRGTMMLWAGLKEQTL